MEHTNKSEIARLMQQIDAEYRSAKLGLTGLAISASHAFINARMEHIAMYTKELCEQVGEQQTFALLAHLSNTSLDTSEEEPHPPNTQRGES